MVEAAAIPETFFTVWHNVFERGALKSGEMLLVHGGSSGIGTTAIMLAKAFGAHVITTAGSDEKCEACREARRRCRDELQDARISSQATKNATGGKGADVILDMVGGDYIDRNYEAAADRGPHRADRVPGQPEGDREFPPHHAQAPASIPARRCARARSPTKAAIAQRASRRRSGR